MKRVVLTLMFVCSLFAVTTLSTGCQTGPQAKENKMTGEQMEAMHPRNETGLYSQSAD